MIIVNPGDPITADLFNKVASSLPKFSTLSNDMGVTSTPDGTLVVNQWNNLMAAPSGNGKLRPFALRWQSTSKTDQNEGEWQIYLPRGCAMLNNDIYWPKNDVGKNQDGDITFGWYKIEEPSNSDADVTQEGKYTFKEWNVYVKFKDYPLMLAETKEKDDDFRVPDRISVGSVSIKEWRDDEGKYHATRKTTQAYGEIYRRMYDTTGSFRLVYECSGDRKSEESYTLKLTNQYITVGREQIWITDDTNITDYEDVVLKIDHSKEKMSISVVDTLEENTIDFTYIRMMRLKDKTMLDDLRSKVRQPFNFYQN